jgi:hypothetical protein
MPTDRRHAVRAASRRRWLFAPLALLILYTVWCTALTIAQESVIFPGADRPRPAADGPTEPGVEQLWITTDQGHRVEAWFKPGAGRSAASPGPAVILFHGNGDLLDTRWQAGRNYLNAGASLLVPEYRGYGRSAGKPSQRAIVADMIQFYDWLRQRPEVDPNRIAFHGISLGGGVALATAEHRKPAAVVLESTFTSIPDLSKRWLVPSFLCRHPFRSDRVIAELDAPVLIFHGRYDMTVPVSHGRRLHELAPNSEYIEQDTGHGDFHSDWKSTREFLLRNHILDPPSDK